MSVLELVMVKCEQVGAVKEALSAVENCMAVKKRLFSATIDSLTALIRAKQDILDELRVHIPVIETLSSCLQPLKVRFDQTFPCRRYQNNILKIELLGCFGDGVCLPHLHRETSSS